MNDGDEVDDAGDYDGGAVDDDGGGDDDDDDDDGDVDDGHDIGADG